MAKAPPERREARPRLTRQNDGVAARRKHYTWPQVIGPLVGLVALVIVGIVLASRQSGSSASTAGRTTTHRASTSRGDILTVDASSLPAEARVTLKLIASHGPFLHRQDGVVFSNRENRLPAQDRGYYHEYTVETPGAPTRGARRIITGSSGQKWYTGDHYRSFQRIRT